MNNLTIELYHKAYKEIVAKVGIEHTNTSYFQGSVAGRLVELVIQESNRRVNQYISDCGEVSSVPEYILEDHFWH